jgi:hypothetical protein
VDKADAPAVDIQQAGGAFQRLTFSVVVFLGALGAIALLGTLSLAVILAQVVALVLLGFAPVALIVGIFPGAGHDVFRGWLAKLATAIFIKALYSLVIALVVAVSAALTAATDSLGFLFAFGLQTLFFWALFVYRKQITSRLVAATTGAANRPGMPRLSVVQRGASAAAAPVTALVGFTRRGRDRGQESALAGTETAPDVNGTAPAPAAVGTGHEHDTVPVLRRNGHPATPATPATATFADPPRAPAADPFAAPRANDTDAPTAGHVAAPSPARFDDPVEARSGDNSQVDVTSVAGPSRMTAGDPLHAGAPAAGGALFSRDATPRSAHEDVMRRARELRERQRGEEPRG